MEKFGTRLRTARKDRGFTLQELALKCGTSEAVLRNYEKARKSPNVEMLLRLCEALKISPDYLLQDELSFNPYEEFERLIQEVKSLPPIQLNLLKDFIVSLRKHSS